MKTIAYYRVSTKKQGDSGLGLEAQKAALESFVKVNQATLVAEYREVESGKHDNRPELAKALAHAKRSKAKLIVAKMDRLSRNATFLSQLLDSGVSFAAVDNPHANELTVRILAAVAQEERRAISDRTKAALGAAKARGVLLGSARKGHWAGREDRRLAGLVKGRRVAKAAVKQAAREAYIDLVPIMTDLQQQGLTLRAIAERLNDMGHTTRRGKCWNASQVMRVIDRSE